MKKYFIGLGLVVLALQLQAQPLQRTRPEKVGMDPAKFIYADEVIHQAIDKHEIPGAVLAMVLLPEPERPTSATVLPGSMIKETSRRAGCSLVG